MSVKNFNDLSVNEQADHIRAQLIARNIDPNSLVPEFMDNGSEKMTAEIVLRYNNHPPKPKPADNAYQSGFFSSGD